MSGADRGNRVVCVVRLVSPRLWICIPSWAWMLVLWGQLVSN